MQQDNVALQSAVLCQRSVGLMMQPALNCWSTHAAVLANSYSKVQLHVAMPAKCPEAFIGNLGSAADSLI
jgi:hypothetical protein